MKYILTADNHFQYNQPVCRTDDFISAQIEKMVFLKELQEKHNAIILNGGDITHKARVDKQELFSMLLKNLPEMYGVAGNHDLIYHNLSYLKNSALGVLISAGLYKFIDRKNPLTIDDDLIYGFSYGQKIEKPERVGDNCTVAIWHHMIYESNRDFTFADGHYAKTVLEKNPEYNFILTGDNHKTFCVEIDGRYLINPGSLTRDDAAQIDHRPCVYLLDSIEKTVKQIFLPVRKNVISTEHLQVKKDRDARLEAFVETVNSNYEIGFSFERNLDDYLAMNPVSKKIKQIIYECTGL